jgi:glycerol-3-phosphate dehydrogenase
VLSEDNVDWLHLRTDLLHPHYIRAQIFNGVYEVLYENQSPKEVIAKIMLTPSRFE